MTYDMCGTSTFVFRSGAMDRTHGSGCVAPLRSRHRRLWAILVLTACIGAAARTVPAASVVVTNASFELPAVSTVNTETYACQNWTYAAVGGSGNRRVRWANTGLVAQDLSQHLCVQVDQVTNAPPNPVKSVTMTSDTRFTFAANKQYALTVALAVQASSADYRVGIALFDVTAGQLVVSNMVSGSSLGTTTWTDKEVTLFTDDHPGVVGHTGAVRLIFEYTGQYSRNAFFDDVRLTAVNANPAINLSSAALSIAEYGGTGSFSAVLATQPSGDVVLDIASSTSGEAIVDKATLTFTPASWSNAQTVTVIGVNDADMGGHDRAFVTVAVNQGLTADAAYASLPAQTVALTLLNDDFLDLVRYAGSAMLSGSGIASSTAPTPGEGVFANSGINTVKVYFTESSLYANAIYNQAQVYGGFEVVEELSQGTFWNSGAFYASQYRMAFGNNDAGAPGRFRGVFMWDKSNFLNGLGDKPVSMGEGDSMSVRVKSDSHTSTGSTTDGMRFIIKNSGCYYYSQTNITASFAIAAGSYTLADVGAHLWAAWDPLAAPTLFTAGHVLPGGGTFSTRTFTNVQAVGISMDMARAQYGGSVAFDGFTVTGFATPAPPPAGTMMVFR